MIPISVVTGFLGCGKTTLISRALRDPAFKRTAVIVNEFGEVGLDHELIVGSDDSVMTLQTGCLCCRVQTDLAQTLMALFWRRDVGSIDYDRVLIETSGICDPAPVLQSVMMDRAVSSTHQTPNVVTLVDAVDGEATLRNHSEARHQVALADHLLLSKTDLRPPPKRLIATLNRLNPGAPCITTIEAQPSELFGRPAIEPLADRLGRMPRRLGHAAIDTVTVVRQRPIPALALAMLLQALAEHCGGRLLRLKGLVAIEEMPNQPAVIHGVRHVVSAPVFLERWPSGDQRSRIVLITKDVPRYFVARLLDGIEAEVRDGRPHC